jgi:hypothetical protein
VGRHGTDPHVRLPDIGADPDPDLDSTKLEKAVHFGHRGGIDWTEVAPKKADLSRLLVEASLRADWSGIEQLLNLGAAAKGNGDSEPMDRRHANHPQIYFNHRQNASNAILAAPIPNPTHSISGLVVAKRACVGYV